MITPAPEPAVIAVDIGGTSLKGALVGPGGEALARRDAPTPARSGGAAVTAAVLDLVEWLANAAPAPGVAAVAAVTPGRVEAGVVRYAANLGWRELDLAGLLTDRFGWPAVVENDVTAAALAEAAIDPGAQDCLFVALGTGVGAAHVRSGVVAPGATGAAGELGHIPVYPDGERCGCGQHGCLEVYASAGGLARRYAATRPPGAKVRRSALEIVGRLGRDRAADVVWREATEALALALATATLVIDPAVVILGGGLAGAGQALLDPVRLRLSARLTWRPPPRVESSTLGSDAGWRGAARQAWSAWHASRIGCPGPNRTEPRGAK